MGYSIEYIDEQISYWKNIRDEFLKEQSEITIVKNTKEMLNKIHTVNNDNSYQIKLYEDSKTLPLIDGYISSGKEFLVVKDFFKIDELSISPVLTVNDKSIYYYKSLLTMTNLKKMRCWYKSTEIAENVFNKESREYALLNCLLKLSYKDIVRGSFEFDYPCKFNAQGSNNRIGYGNEYVGEELVIEGTKYGETTTFYFIGILARPFCEYIQETLL